MMARRRQGLTLFPTLGLPAPVILTVLSLAGCGAAPSPEPSAPSFRPNVLILFSDDQRADTIAALGNPHIRTPHLDRLVRRGTAFTRAYCMGSMQGAVCVPSRAMLLTGRTLFHVEDDLAGQATWPEAFARAGYVTFLTGKWHNSSESALRAFQEGKSDLLRRHGRSVQPALRGHLATAHPGRTPEERGPFGQADGRRRGGVPPRTIGSHAVPLLCGVQRASRPAPGPAVLPRLVQRPSAADPRELPSPASVRQRCAGDPGRKARPLAANSGDRPPAPRRLLRRDRASRRPGRPHPRRPRGERPGREDPRRLHQRPWPGDRQPRALRQAEPLRSLDALAPHHGRARHSQGPTDRRAVLPARHLPHPGRARRRSWSRGQRGPEPGPDPRGPAANRSRLHLHRLCRHPARRPRRATGS